LLSDEVEVVVASTLPLLIHEKILTPTMIANTDELLDKSDMIRATRPPGEFETDLLRCMVSLFIIAFQTGANQIFPGIGAAIDFGDNMIDGHLCFLFAAILTSAAITLNNIFSGKHDPLNWYLNVKLKLDNRGNRNLGETGTKHMAIRCFNDFRLAEIKHYHGALYATNGNRLEILV
jgi:hypothetical protein